MGWSPGANFESTASPIDICRAWSARGRCTPCFALCTRSSPGRGPWASERWRRAWPRRMPSSRTCRRPLTGASAVLLATCSRSPSSHHGWSASPGSGSTGPTTSPTSTSFGTRTGCGSRRPPAPCSTSRPSWTRSPWCPSSRMRSTGVSAPRGRSATSRSDWCAKDGQAPWCSERHSRVGHWSDLPPAARASSCWRTLSSRPACRCCPGSSPSRWTVTAASGSTLPCLLTGSTSKSTTLRGTPIQWPCSAIIARSSALGERLVGPPGHERGRPPAPSLDGRPPHDALQRAHFAQAERLIPLER